MATLVSEQKVFEVCDQLAGAGDDITVVAVRKLLGGGSMSDIGPLVKKWKALKKSSALPAAEFEVPPMPTDELATYLAPWWHQLWKTIYGQANERIATIKAEAEQRCATLQRDNELLQAEFQQQQSLIDELTSQIEESRQSHTQLELLVDEQTTQLLERTNALTEKEQHIVSLGNQVELLQEKISSREQLLESANQQVGQLNIDLSKLGQENERLGEERFELQKQLAESTSMNGRLTEVNEELKESLSNSQQSLNHLTDERYELQKQLVETKSQVGRINDKNNELELSLSQSQQLASDLDISVTTLTKEKAVLSEEQEALRTELRDAEVSAERNDRTLLEAENDLEQAHTMLESLNDKVAEMERSKAELNQSLLVGEAAVSSYAAQNKILERHVSDLQIQLAATREMVGSLQQQNRAE